MCYEYDHHYHSTGSTIVANAATFAACQALLVYCNYFHYYLFVLSLVFPASLYTAAVRQAKLYKLSFVLK